MVDTLRSTRVGAIVEQISKAIKDQKKEAIIVAAKGPTPALYPSLFEQVISATIRYPLAFNSCFPDSVLNHSPFCIQYGVQCTPVQSTSASDVKAEIQTLLSQGQVPLVTKVCLHQRGSSPLFRKMSAVSSFGYIKSLVATSTNKYISTDVLFSFWKTGGFLCCCPKAAHAELCRAFAMQAPSSMGFCFVQLFVSSLFPLKLPCGGSPMQVRTSGCTKVDKDTQVREAAGGSGWELSEVNKIRKYKSTALPITLQVVKHARTPPSIIPQPTRAGWVDAAGSDRHRSSRLSGPVPGWVCKL